jgi:hypothetical protein
MKIMAKNFLCKVVAVLMAIALPASVMSAETRNAMLFASNTAVLNGTIFQRTSAVFPGDKLSVPAKSAVTINLNGSSILVPAFSNITYNGDSVALEPQAAVAVTTTKGMAAQIKDIKISPAKDGSAKYQVARYNGQVFVAAKQGTVLIASAAGSHVLAEGSTTTLPDPEQEKKNKCDDPDPNKRAKCCNDPDEKKRKECEAAAAATGVGSTPATTGVGAAPATTGIGVGALPTWVAVLIGTAAAGIAAGAAIATTGPPVSPVGP